MKLVRRGVTMAASTWQKARPHRVRDRRESCDPKEAGTSTCLVKFERVASFVTLCEVLCGRTGFHVVLVSVCIGNSLALYQVVWSIKIQILSSQGLGDCVIQNWKVNLWPNPREVSLFRELSVCFGTALISSFVHKLSFQPQHQLALLVNESILDYNFHSSELRVKLFMSGFIPHMVDQKLRLKFSVEAYICQSESDE